MVAVLGLGLGLAGLAAAATSPLTGIVTEVIDGQTVVITPATGAPLTLRLAGIEVPLPCQAWAGDARDALKEWVAGRQVTVRAAGRPGRTGLRGMLLLDGADINRRMVAEGHAWSERGRSDHGPYVKEERMAHALSRGLHAEAGAQPPRLFLRNHGPCAKAS
jgi:endonuclease YncB( thermonuclease family)